MTERRVRTLPFGEGSGFSKRGLNLPKLRKILKSKPKTPEQQAEQEAAKKLMDEWRGRSGGRPAPGAGQGKRKKYYDATKKPKGNKKSWE